MFPNLPLSGIQVPPLPPPPHVLCTVFLTPPPPCPCIQGACVIDLSMEQAELGL